VFCASFSDKTIEHFMCPQNLGDMPDADAVGIGGEPGCGDYLAIFIKVKDNVIIVEALDGLPEHKLHCSVWGATA